jgi:hypothetical protein
MPVTSPAHGRTYGPPIDHTPDDPADPRETAMTTISTFSNLTRIAMILAAGSVVLAAAGTAEAGHVLAGSAVSMPITSSAGSFAPPAAVVRDHRGPSGAPQGGVSVGPDPSHPCSRDLNRCPPQVSDWNGLIHNHRN